MGAGGSSTRAGGQCDDRAVRTACPIPTPSPTPNAKNRARDRDGQKSSTETADAYRSVAPGNADALVGGDGKPLIRGRRTGSAGTVGLCRHAGAAWRAGIHLG